jgi:cysteine dioxygenase
MFSNGHYTRNLVSQGNKMFNLMILCWNEGQGSPIHDHSAAHCIVKVLDGSLAESLYEWPSATTGISLKKTSQFDAGQVTYMHDKIGLHAITNPSKSKKAVSLHLYSPPFEYCKTFCEKVSF